MKLMLLSLLLAVAAFAADSSASPETRKESLRKFLTPEFVLTAIPKEREEDFYLVLEAFVAVRRRDEFVRSITFESATSASLAFSNSGWHGGGTAAPKKVDGKWVIGDKWYYL